MHDNHKIKLAIEASRKIFMGEQLMKEGMLELESLLGTHRPLQETREDKTTGFRKESRSRETLGKFIISTLLKEGSATTSFLRKTLKCSDRTLSQVLAKLISEGTIKDETPDGRSHTWTVVDGATVLDNTKDDSKKRLDIKHPDIQNRAIEMIRNDEWITQTKLAKDMGIGVSTAGKIVKMLTRKKLVRAVVKTHNPRHIAGGPSVYNRPQSYLELVP